MTALENAEVTDEPVLRVRNLVKHFGGARNPVRAVDGIDLTIGRGEIVGLVGESGSGKSTVGRCIARLTKPTSGTVEILGKDVSTIGRSAMRPMRRDVHMVFQDPYSSLNPRMTVGDIVAEPLRQQREKRIVRERRVGEMLERAGLRKAMAARYPHELSGGQRQRVALARSLALGPRLLIADEPVSALDVSVQASILNLVVDLQKDLGFSCLFITHDLSVVEFISDRIAVMYLGRIVEESTREASFQDPQHPYSQALLSAAPLPDPRLTQRERIVLSGTLPSPAAPPPGCHFHTRCPVAVDMCKTDVPELIERKDQDHFVRCHLVTPEGKPLLVKTGANVAARGSDAPEDVVTATAGRV